MKDDWSKTCEAFRNLAARKGVHKIAAEVPANPTTIYRFIKGDTLKPSRAVKVGIERVVREHRLNDEPAVPRKDKEAPA